MAISEFRKEYEAYLASDTNWLNVIFATGLPHIIDDPCCERRYSILDVETTAAPTFRTWLNGKK